MLNEHIIKMKSVISQLSGYISYCIAKYLQHGQLKYREEAYESMIPQTWKRLLDNNCKFSED
jgi:NADPH-dependent curcumin reductase CurA